jgi:hypothetical protein
MPKFKHTPVREEDKPALRKALAAMYADRIAKRASQRAEARKGNFFGTPRQALPPQ